MTYNVNFKYSGISSKTFASALHIEMCLMSNVHGTASTDFGLSALHVEKMGCDEVSWAGTLSCIHVEAG